MFNYLKERQRERSHVSSRMDAKKEMVTHFTCLGHHVMRVAELDEGSIPLVTRYSRGPAHSLLCVAEEQGRLSIYNVGEMHTGHLLAPVVRWAAQRDIIYDVKWTRHNARLLSASGDNQCRLWDVENTAQPLMTFNGHSGTVKCAAFHERDDYVFATASRDKNVMLWDTRQRAKMSRHQTPYVPAIATFANAHTESAQVTGCFFSADDQLLVTSGSDGTVRYWDMRMFKGENSRWRGQRITATPVTIIEVRDPGARGVKRPHGISCLARNTMGTRFVATSRDNSIYEYTLLLPEAPPRIYPDVPVRSFDVKSCYSPDDNFILSGSSESRAYIFDASSCYCSGEPLMTLIGHGANGPCEVSDVDWNPNWQNITTCSDDGTVRLWTLQGEKPRLMRAPQLDQRQEVPARQRPRSIQRTIQHYFGANN